MICEQCLASSNTKETLATQGNVINTIRKFWDKLREKLVYAVTRADVDKEVGNNYIPVYVSKDGEVKVCNAGMINVTISNGNITSTNIPTPITGTILYLNIGGKTGTDPDNLTVNSKTVKYPSNVNVKTSNINQGDVLVLVYAKNVNDGFWILLNKMNTASTTASNQTTDPGSETINGSNGLMTPRDKAKLDGIAWGANKYELKAATKDTLGGVKLGADKLPSLSTPTATSTSNRYYPIQTDKNNKLIVNVPWQENTDNYYTSSIAANSNGDNNVNVKNN